MNLAEVTLISQYPAWHWFGTLTFRVTPSRGPRFRAAATCYLKRVAGCLGLDYSCLFSVLRDENGELNGRGHYHFLLGDVGLPQTPTGSFTLQRLWSRAGMGFASVHVFDNGRRGIEYVTKCLIGSALSEGARYEMRKFASVENPLVMSPALQKWLAVQLERGDRVLRRQGRGIVGACYQADGEAVYDGGWAQSWSKPGFVQSRAAEPKQANAGQCGAVCEDRPGTLRG